MTTTRIIAGMAALALLGTGCSSEAITERIAEEAAEQIAGGDAQIDLDLDEDGGGIAVDSSEGSMQMGAGGSLPDGFPDDLPLPGDYQVGSSFEQATDDGENHMAVALGTTIPVDDVVAHLESALPDAGWEISDTRRQSMDDFVNVTFVASRDDGMGAMVTVVSDSDDETLVNYMVGEGLNS